MTRNGLAYRQRLWVLAISGIDGGALRLPTAQDTRRRGKNSSQRGLSNTEDWLPTPKASDGERGRDKARARPDMKSRELATVLRDSLPSPRTCSAMAAQVNSTANLKGKRFLNLETVIGRMLPTPTASFFNDGESPDSWMARRARIKEKGINGNWMEMPLSIAAQLLTPTANDWKSQTNWEARERHGPQRLPDCLPTGEATYLNPCFVEEMMGFPVGWTD